MKKLFLLFTLAFLIFSCREDDADSPETRILGKEYVSLKIGQETVFQIDSTIYDEFTGRVKLISLQQRLVVASSENDQANREAFIVEIYNRSDDTLPWLLNRVTRRTLIEFRYEILDNNVIKVPLVFPVELGKIWNSNVLNSFSEKQFEFTKVNDTHSNGTLQYDSTITVLQAEDFNLIEQRLEREVHAIGIGLVFREHKEIETELNGDIRSGFEVTKRLISFSK